MIFKSSKIRLQVKKGKILFAKQQGENLGFS